MKSSTAILSSVCVVCLTILSMCLGVGWFFRGSSRQEDQNRQGVEKRSEANEDEMVSVLKARHRLNARTYLKEPDDLFDLDRIPKKDAPPDLVDRASEVRHLVLSKSLDEGAILTRDQVLSKPASVVARLTDGKRAYAIETGSKLLGGGYVEPGSRIDIIHVSGSEKEAEAKMLLENIHVLDVADADPTVNAGILTLEVTPEEAVVLARAAASGSFVPVLRPADK